MARKIKRHVQKYILFVREAKISLIICKNSFITMQIYTFLPTPQKRLHTALSHGSFNAH